MSEGPPSSVAPARGGRSGEAETAVRLPLDGQATQSLPIRTGMSEQRIIPVILSGGSGTRLWPVSRESFPKQFWPLLSDRSLIQETALRAQGPCFAPPIVVCN